ncbi:hypothetical protein JTB14_034411 [Gonioctena quinquepunctata]|nr:hypothetical protein JTB14_034411 [Gonioctena quinquepunctata]
MVYVVASNKVEHIKKPSVQDNERNIHNSLKFFLVYSQILGILPQENITGSYTELCFKWGSWKVMYTLVMTFITSFAVLTCFLNWFYVGYNFSNLGTHFFYSTTVLTLILYLRLAKHWSKLMASWCRMDKAMNDNYGYPEADYSLSVWSRYIAINMRWGKEYDYKLFYLISFPQLFNFVPVNIVTGIYCSMMTIHASLIWAFNDLFIIIMSIALAVRFRQLTRRMVEHFREAKSEQFWVKVREDYDRLSILCKELDDRISYIVLLSYTLNIFFLLVQLYSSLR